MEPNTVPVDPVDEAVRRLGEDGRGAGTWLVGWLARHPDQAAGLALRLAERGENTPATGLAYVPDVPGSGEGSAAAPPRLPGYEVLGELGRGGMGVVYEARQVGLNRVVALKVIRTGEFASPREVQRFRLEAETAASLRHPNIVPVYEEGERDGVVFYSMMRHTGGSLARRLRAGPRLEPREAARALAATAGAVHHAHQRGVIHRDLKPANILLDEHGRPHVSDFGLARRLDAAHSIGPTGAAVGTPSYMAPEQARGDELPGVAVDVYGLGAVLYECLTGRPPFRGENALATMASVQHDPVVKPRELNPTVPADLEGICLRCLAKDPADRYPSAEALAEDLERFLRGEATGERPPVLDRLFKAVTRPPRDVGLITVPAIWWAAGLTFAYHAAIFSLTQAGVRAAWVWVAYAATVALAAAVAWRHHIALPISLVRWEERVSLALNLGALAGKCVLLAIATMAAPGGPAAPAGALLLWLYPPLTVVYGLLCFAHGAIYFGALYLVGLGLMLLAVVVALLPDWSPLIFGGSMALLFGWAATVLQRYRGKVDLPRAGEDPRAP